MSGDHIVLTAVLALLIERLFGYPGWLHAHIAHPVMWIGEAIGRLDKRLNKSDAADNRLRGAVALAILLVVVAFAALLAARIAALVPMGFIFEAILASSLLAQKSLADHVSAVAAGLTRDLAAGRDAVAKIVGRDSAALSEGEVAQAAIESLAENTADGVIAPLFWFLVAGLPGIVLYKAINTADSMIGHRNARYCDFGWAAARLDDLVNIVPARLSGLLFAVAALISGGGRAAVALATMWRDAPKHRSPNAGWPEAAVAGALGVRLGGPRAYNGASLDLPTMGDGRATQRRDIARALRLYRTALNIVLSVMLAALIVVSI